MLMGACGGEARDPDFSGMHTAVLWGGSTLLSAALVRAFGPVLAEVPLIATRPEAQVRSSCSLATPCLCGLSGLSTGLPACRAMGWLGCCYGP